MGLVAYGLARIGRDAELRRTNAGDAVVSLSLAFNYGRKDESGKRPTQWLEGNLWGARAESMAEYLLKGTAVVVSVEDLHEEKYQTRDGTPGSKLVGRILAIDFAGSPAAAPAPAPAPRPAAQRPAPAGRGAAPEPKSGTGFDDMNDDIPFISASAGFDMESRHQRRMRRFAK